MNRLRTHLALSFILALTLTASVRAVQDVPRARLLLQQAMDALTPTPPPPPPPVVLADMAAFKAAYAKVQPGDVLTLAPTFVYTDALTIDKAVTIQVDGGAVPGVVMTADEPAPAFTGGLTVSGQDVTLVGIQFTHPSPLSTIVNVSGVNPTLRHVRITGDPVKGGKRGINYTGSNLRLTDSRITSIFQAAQDTQAVYSDNMGPGTMVMENNFFEAAGEVVMFGGGDPATPDRQPHDVTLNTTVMAKRAEWTTTNLQQVKCALELKNIRGFQSKGCTFIRGGGISQGQGGYAFDLTVRNQNGTAPESCVQDVVIEDFTIDMPGSGIASISGYDSNFPSGKLRNLTIRRGTVTNVDSKALPGTTGRLFTFDHAPEQVTIQDILVKGINIKSIFYFQGLVPPTGLTVGIVSVDNGGVAIPYRYKLDGNTHPVGVNWPTNVRAALMAYMPDAVLDAGIQ